MQETFPEVYAELYDVDSLSAAEQLVAKQLLEYL